MGEIRVSTPALRVVVPASEEAMLPVYVPFSGLVLPSDILPSEQGPAHKSNPVHIVGSCVGGALAGAEVIY